MKTDENTKIGIIGLGYVGLPLAVEFSRLYNTIGFDIDEVRVSELNAGHDKTLEVEDKFLSSNEKLHFTTNPEVLREANIFIVTVPTPIDAHQQPDLTPLKKASSLIGSIIKKDDIVIYESTVFPGATEDECIPVVEEVSGLTFNKDFFAGYSPERINPGDKSRPVTKIVKVTSGSTPEIAKFVDELYASIISAGTYLASSIKVAEASKVIENTQRDVNIALINELSMIFDVLDIPTNDVLEAAATKWNFINLKPGLVGGHCIGVDPYYLLHKSMSAGFVPDIIRTSREINDGMSKYLASKFIRMMISEGVSIKGSKVVVLGYTFKENCPDVRNTKIKDFVNQLEEFGIDVVVHDPLAMENPEHLPESIKFVDLDSLKANKADAVFVAVAHSTFKEISLEDILNEKSVIYDFKQLYK
ncbi:nucleotide sugar dehydrogenase [Alteromonas sp. ASW11-130]|uniref:nucleotide sugar dehydrogenase n=1 Tax=Alteromonas sp. ASW11-130 TaxID=3015775 RepID=UPI002242A543|nr:nucleotide sugar dehydrogenase [Alteromonas sp. ASW11-130]MCW8090798.1 nucleotide sugar dehydrogenase [Alteromonas sp. ASW11-130]